MTANEINVKMVNAHDKYTKRVATTEKLVKRAEKYWDIAVAKGYDVYVDANNNNRIYLNDITDENVRRDAFDILCSWKHTIEDVKSSREKETALLNTYNNWVEKYKSALDKESETSAFPDIFKELIENLADEWTSYDIEKRKRMKKAKEELYNNYSWDAPTVEERKAYSEAYRAYRIMFPVSEEKRLNQSDEKLWQDNRKVATNYVHDLIRRIKGKIGDIVSFENIHFSGIALNGIVEGTLGSVRLETIIAGGYNIQREHYRVLVKDI